MAPPAKNVLSDDEVQNAAVVNWISNRLGKIRLGEAAPLPLVTGMKDEHRGQSIEEWIDIEAQWGRHPNTQAAIRKVNQWIELYLPAGSHAAGKERQKMLMTLRAVRASRNRRASGVIRIEFDLETSTVIRQLCEDEGLGVFRGEGRSRQQPESLIIHLAVMEVMGNKELRKKIVNQVGAQLQSRRG